mmetsp:Transcript_4436/g.7548  ORF Transcript_4436/g.7548 Transcript_4436/m.7548 type:complete len:107 (+) Transcript_4436:400-720(+)
MNKLESQPVDAWYLSSLRTLNVGFIILLTLSSIGCVWYLAWRLVLSEISFVQELLGMPKPQQEVPPSGSTTRRRYGHVSSSPRHRSTSGSVPATWAATSRTSETNR